LKPKPRGAKPRGAKPRGGGSATRARRRPPHRVSTSRARAPGASGARERTLGEWGRLRLRGLGACSQDEPATHGGIGRSRGRARGLFGLQKSTSGAWSRSRDHGSSLWLSSGRLSGQSSAGSRIAVAKATSTRAASNETGDRLLVIPRAYGESPKRAGEGEIVDGRRSDPARSSSLTSRRRRWIQRPHAKGIRSRDQVRGGSREGRQRLRRKLGLRLKTPRPGDSARRSNRSKLRQDRAASGSRGYPGPQPRVPRDELRQRLKLEVRRQAKLHLVDSSGKRRAKPQPRRRVALGPG